MAAIHGPDKEPPRTTWQTPHMPLTGEYAPSTSAWARRQAERYEATDGADQGELRGRLVIVLTSVGARTGMLRKTALMRVEHEGAYAVVASMGGAPDNPRWFYNLKAHPHVELQDRATKLDYLARELEGDEKAMWWDRSIAVWPDYDAYQAKTTRQIPVFVLEPLAGEDPQLGTPCERDGLPEPSAPELTAAPTGSAGGATGAPPTGSGSDLGRPGTAR